MAYTSPTPYGVTPGVTASNPHATNSTEVGYTLWNGQILGPDGRYHLPPNPSTDSSRSYSPMTEYGNLTDFFKQMFYSPSIGGGGAVAGGGGTPLRPSGGAGPVFNPTTPTPAPAVNPPAAVTTTPDSTTKDPGSNFLADSLTGGGSYAQQLMDQYMASMSGPAGGVETYGYEA